MTLKNRRIVAMSCVIIGIVLMGFDLIYSFGHFLDPHPFMNTTALLVIGYLLVISGLAILKHYMDSCCSWADGDWLGLAFSNLIMNLSLIFLATLTMLFLGAGLYVFTYSKNKRSLWLGSLCLAFIFFVLTYLRYAASV